MRPRRPTWRACSCVGKSKDGLARSPGFANAARLGGRRSARTVIRRRPGLSDGLLQQLVVTAEDGQPLVHLLCIGFVDPMLKELSGVTQRHPLAGRMDFESK